MREFKRLFEELGYTFQSADVLEDVYLFYKYYSNKVNKGVSAILLEGDPGCGKTFLSIIAYKQPITRVEIEELRGVGCEMMLKRLLARELIREAGRSEAPGKPILYEVTDEFMDSFKLEDLGQLPDLPQYDEEKEDLFND